MIKKDLSLYLVTNAGVQYKLPIYSDVRYSQTINEEQIPYKTLHEPLNLIQGGFASKYNAGSFEFTIPLMDSTVAQVLFGIFFALNPTTYSLFYIENGITVKLNTCVTDRITFNFQKDAITTASITGQYSNSVNTPLSGTPAASLGSLYTYIQGIGITLAGADMPNLTNFSIEMSNDISWVENNTMHVDVPYPTEFYCSEKTLSGNFSRNEDLNLPSYYDSTTLVAQIKSNGAIFLEFNFPSVFVTTRPELSDVIQKGYDFRINGNTNNQVLYKGVNIL